MRAKHIYLAIVATLLTILGYQHVETREMEKMYDGAINALMDDSAKEKKLLVYSIEQLQSKLSETERELLDLNQQIGVYFHLQKAGFEAGSVTEISSLLELSRKAPFGSPFIGGHYVTSSWGPRNSPIDGRVHKHLGIDIVAKGSWTVHATADGEITDFGESETYGKYIIFDTTGGYRLKYAHLSKIFWQDLDKRLVKGVKVTKGSKLGVMGETGQATGPHLHYEIMVQSPDGNYVNLEPDEILNYIGTTDEGETK